MNQHSTQWSVLITFQRRPCLLLPRILLRFYKVSALHMTIRRYAGTSWMKSLYSNGNLDMNSVNKFAQGLKDSVGAQMRKKRRCTHACVAGILK